MSGSEIERTSSLEGVGARLLHATRTAIAKSTKSNALNGLIPRHPFHDRASVHAWTRDPQRSRLDTQHAQLHHNI